MLKNNDILFFDGVCSLCNGSVDFLIKIDKQKLLKYSSLQGELAKKMISVEKVKNMESLVFFTAGNYYERSQAIVHILLKLGGLYKVIGSVLNIIPSSILDVLYNFISKNRYKFFGKRETCRLPSEDEKDLFL